MTKLMGPVNNANLIPAPIPVSSPRRVTMNELNHPDMSNDEDERGEMYKIMIKIFLISNNKEENIDEDNTSSSSNKNTTATTKMKIE